MNDGINVRGTTPSNWGRERLINKWLLLFFDNYLEIFHDSIFCMQSVSVSVEYKINYLDLIYRLNSQFSSNICQYQILIDR